MSPGLHKSPIQAGGRGPGPGSVNFSAQLGGGWRRAQGGFGASLACRAAARLAGASRDFCQSALAPLIFLAAPNQSVAASFA